MWTIDPALAVSIAIPALGAVVWLVRLEAKVHAQARDIQRLEKELDEAKATIKALTDGLSAVGSLSEALKALGERIEHANQLTATNIGHLAEKVAEGQASTKREIDTLVDLIRAGLPKSTVTRSRKVSA